MKPLYEYLNESYKWTKEDSQCMSDILDVLSNEPAGENSKSSILKYCPNLGMFTNFMDDNEKSILPSIKDKFSKSGKIQLTKDEKNLVTRIAVFAYKNAHILDARLSNLYHNALAL